MSVNAPEPVTSPTPDALEALLQAERSFAARLETARAEARARVERAQDEARELESKLDDDIAAAVARLEADAAAALDAAVDAIRSTSAATCAHFDGVDDTRIREHAAFAIREILAGAAD